MSDIIDNRETKLAERLAPDILGTLETRRSA